MSATNKGGTAGPGRWPEGEETIEQMIASGALGQVVRADPADIEALFNDAASHFDSADQIKQADPRGAYSLMYSGLRKTLAAALLKQGLRATGGEGGHHHVYLAIKAQLGTAAGAIVDPFDRMRRKRNAADYDAGAPIDVQDVEEDLIKAREIAGGVRRWAPRLGLF